MAGVVKHEPRHAEHVDVFDRMFDEWPRWFPFRRPAFFAGHWNEQELIRVDEYRENGTLVVRAELPGIDPDKDVELTFYDGMLQIEAQRREEEKTEKKGYVRQELRYGSFTRTLVVPEGVTESDITANYKDGILEIRIPTPQVEPAKKIAISKS